MSDDPSLVPERHVESPAGDLLASIGLRGAALAVDSLIVGVPVAAVALATDHNPLSDDVSSTALLVITAAWLAVGLLYETVGVAVFARTLGKAMFGMKVVRSVDGGRVGWTYAAMRAVVPALVGLVPYIGIGLQLAVYMRAPFHPWRQGWHDIAAGTLVVSTRAADAAVR